MKRPNTAALQRQCDQWNAANPIGQIVTVQFDSGDIKLTKTRSAAYVLSGHSAVVFLDGISGCYSLDRVVAQ